MKRSITPRHQLILRVEFDDAAGFRSNYLSDFPQGGVQISASLEVGQRFVLNVAFRERWDPLQVHAVVRWSLPEAHPNGPAAGLAFVDPSPEARTWLGDILDGVTQNSLLTQPSNRVLLLEAQPFLREIYGQEVRNWAQLRDEGLDLVALGDVAAWCEEVASIPAALGIIDVDGLPTAGIDLYRRVRADPRSTLLPLVMIGSPASIEPFSLISDELLACLHKPLRFGHLMKTVRVLARSPLPASSRASGRSRD